MIRVYLALFLLLISGVSFVASGMPIVKTVGTVEILAALIGLHAHYTSEKS